MSSPKKETPASASVSDVAKAAEDQAVEFPVAGIKEAASAGLLRYSNMWWVTLICLLGAIFLVWKSMPQTGTVITIHFPEGHGLKAEDTVRFRGIDVGRVTEVALNHDLSGIDVSVMLNPGGGSLDREGTRFWIVRPRLSLTEVSGLDTAVGAKYIGVSPGEPAAPVRRIFDGLAAAPPDELDYGGLEVVLRSDDRHGTSPGAPVTWRGVKAGKVLSVNLSPDARHVNVTVRIDRAYRRLVRPSTKFWVNSGFAVDVGLTGIKLNAESLATIVQGGVSFISPPDGTTSEAVRNGHVFVLADDVDKEWLQSAANIPLVDFPLPETVLVKGQQKSSLLGFQRSKEFVQTGLLVSDAGKSLLLTSAIAVDDDQAALPDFQVLINADEPLLMTGVSNDDSQSPISGMLQIKVSGVDATVGWDSFRAPSNPEDCLVVRSAITDGKSTPLIQTIDFEHLQSFQENWSIHLEDADFSEWQGAPVIAMADGKIIGFLQTDSGRPIVSIYRAGVSAE
ncbi:MAG: MlaD family protein [Fuerstiella sp.]